MSFAHLRIHTHYSVNDSIVKLPELFARASELGLDAIAITDPSVMSGVPEFLSLSLRYPEIKPIVDGPYLVTTRMFNLQDPKSYALDVIMAEYSQDAGGFFVPKFAEVIAWTPKPLPFVPDDEHDGECK